MKKWKQRHGRTNTKPKAISRYIKRQERKVNRRHERRAVAPHHHHTTTGCQKSLEGPAVAHTASWGSDSVSNCVTVIIQPGDKDRKREKEKEKKRAEKQMKKTSRECIT